jgi:transposase InsO family protein
VYESIQARTQGQGELSIERMCHLAGVSRAGFYRQWQTEAPDEEETAVRAAIQEIALAHRRNYGRPRITQELRRRGMAVNHKRVGRILREDNLLAIRRRKFIRTTDARHEYPVYMNVAGRLTVTGINQLWVADFTYIRLPREFVYLAVVLDRFSRKAIGWALDRKLTAELGIRALEDAVSRRQPPPGVVHHSDRGVQYCCGEYMAVLEKHQMTASTSRPANPYDNAVCERFMKTLKSEEIYCRDYRDLADLSAHVQDFLENYYNRLRLHSALGYRSPEEFEREQAAGATASGGGAAVIRPFQPPQARREGASE